MDPALSCLSFLTRHGCELSVIPPTDMLVSCRSFLSRQSRKLSVIPNKVDMAVSCKSFHNRHGRICLFVWGFSPHSRIFHSFGDVTITGEGLHIFYICSALMAVEQ